MWRLAPGAADEPPDVAPPPAPGPPVAKAAPAEAPKPYVLGKGGSVLSLAGRKLGRVYCNPFKKDLSVHCACLAKGHVRCEKWQRIALIPGEDHSRCAMWVAKGSEYPDSESHLQAWDDIVMYT